MTNAATIGNARIGGFAMYQSRSFYRGYASAIATIAHLDAVFVTPEGRACGRALALCHKAAARANSSRLSGAARYYQLGIEAAILDAFGC